MSSQESTQVFVDFLNNPKKEEILNRRLKRQSINIPEDIVEILTMLFVLGKTNQYVSTHKGISVQNLKRIQGCVKRKILSYENELNEVKNTHKYLTDLRDQKSVSEITVKEAFLDNIRLSRALRCSGFKTVADLQKNDNWQYSKGIGESSMKFVKERLTFFNF